MNKKGQVSFEMLLITTVVFVVTIAIIGYHFAEQDTTTAMMIAKGELLSEFSDESVLCIIEKIDYSRTADTIQLDVKIKNYIAGDTCDPDVSEIQTKIVDSTNFTTAVLNLS